jgi:hypothetical protein
VLFVVRGGGLKVAVTVDLRHDNQRKNDEAMERPGTLVFFISSDRDLASGCLRAG